MGLQSLAVPEVPSLPGELPLSLSKSRDICCAAGRTSAGAAFPTCPKLRPREGMSGCWREASVDYSNLGVCREGGRVHLGESKMRRECTCAFTGVCAHSRVCVRVRCWIFFPVCPYRQMGSLLSRNFCLFQRVAWTRRARCLTGIPECCSPGIMQWDGH
ncbi:hypothetical protein KIL84_014950 [Mauremys mutica]|uniref:Uncharacterized protein n=1 Tax=Mauremys mutica TaxID=74926 RepID=A0A9D4B8T4_9SAUR|nr:hypothetical protein KIL84_014950 [Mauremys mutica]